MNYSVRGGDIDWHSKRIVDALRSLNSRLRHASGCFLHVIVVHRDGSETRARSLPLITALRLLATKPRERVDALLHFTLEHGAGDSVYFKPHLLDYLHDRRLEKLDSHHRAQCEMRRQCARVDAQIAN